MPAFPPKRRLRPSPLSRLAAATTMLVSIPAAMTMLATAPARAASPPGDAAPFTEYLAVNAQTNGTILGPSYTFGTLASEATGRQAVQLIGQGRYVQFTLTAPANAVDFHYAIPDSLDGTGLTEPLDLYVNGTPNQTLSLTSQYSWLYGSYSFDNTPTDYGYPGTSAPHDFYNDVRTTFSSTLPAGTTVKLQVDSGDNSPWYVINTADFESIPAPLAQPSGYINATASPYNADTTGVNDSTTALQNAINAAESAGTGVYLPQGTYKISSPLNVNKVSVAGAGEWYTEITGSHVEFSGQINPASSNVNVHDLSIFGNVNARNDGDGTVTGFNGGFSNSTISNVWIQNEKVGAWIVGPAANLTFNNMRIQDTTADGVNFDGGVTGSTVENSFLRNTGDDGLAMWSNGTADSGDAFTQNTVGSPTLANNIAIYGGNNNSVTNNLVQDTVTRGGGIHVGNRFSAVALSGTTTISGNKLVRTGQFDPGWDYGVGAIWFYALNSAMTGTINVTGNEIDNSPYEAFQFQGTGVGGYSISNVNLTNNTVNGVGTYVFQDQTSGSASVSGLVASGVGVASVQDCSSGFTLNQGSGNSGWSTSSSVCGFPATWPLWIDPSTLTFENATVGATTPAQKVVIMNTGSAAASLGAITATSGFSVTSDPSQPCGTSLAATNPGGNGSWCELDVTFTPPASGITLGTLSIRSGEPGSPDTVQLVGSTGGNNVATPPTITPGSLAFGYEDVGSTSATQTLTVSNLGPAAITISSVTASGPFPQTNTCGSSLAAGASCTISVSFAPTVGGAQTGEVAVANSATRTPISAALSGTGVTPTTNLALGATMTASGSTAGYPPSNANDGNTGTYWESTDNAFPQWLMADLGAVTQVGSITLTLPPSTSWATRTQTLSVLGSADGTNFTTLVGSAGYTFDPAKGNTVTIALPTSNERYLKLNFTANTGWPAGQVSEFEIFSGTTGSGNFAAGATMTASGSTAGYPPSNANDGNTGTYWESTDNAFPQWLQADFGVAEPVGRIVINLPPSAAWATRTQTITILGSTDGTTFTTLVPSAGYTFNPSTGNVVTITLSAATVRFLRLSFTANTGWPAGQVSELSVYAS
jgi:hypothetical protein